MAEERESDRPTGDAVTSADLVRVESDDSMPRRSIIVAMSNVEFETALADIKLEQERFDRIVATAMTPGIDYGRLPGMKQDMLYAEGAGTLERLFHLRPTFAHEHLWGDGVTSPSYTCVSTCNLIDERGRVVYSSTGIASSHESKHRWRIGKAECPDCQKPSIMRSKFPPRNRPDATPGFYCNPKNGGCGHNFDASDERILEQVVGKIENPDIADIYEAVLQSADKRARVMAIRRRTGASRRFTQDEDVMRNQLGVEEESSSASESASEPRAWPIENQSGPGKRVEPISAYKPPDDELAFFEALLTGVTNGKPAFTTKEIADTRDWLDALAIGGGSKLTEKDVRVAWEKGCRSLAKRWHERTRGAAYPIPMPTRLRSDNEPQRKTAKSDSVAPRQLVSDFHALLVTKINGKLAISAADALMLKETLAKDPSVPAYEKAISMCETAIANARAKVERETTTASAAASNDDDELPF